MRRLTLVTYDIREPERLRRVFRLMKGYGEHTQYSVFVCRLSPALHRELQGRLRRIIDMEVDQVLFVDLGPVGARSARVISALGQPYEPPETGPVIV